MRSTHGRLAHWTSSRSPCLFAGPERACPQAELPVLLRSFRLWWLVGLALRRACRNSELQSCVGHHAQEQQDVPVQFERCWGCIRVWHYREQSTTTGTGRERNHKPHCRVVEGIASGCVRVMRGPRSRNYAPFSYCLRKHTKAYWKRCFIRVLRHAYDWCVKGEPGGGSVDCLPQGKPTHHSLPAGTDKH